MVQWCGLLERNRQQAAAKTSQINHKINLQLQTLMAFTIGLDVPYPENVIKMEPRLGVDKLL